MIILIPFISVIVLFSITLFILIKMYRWEMKTQHTIIKWGAGWAKVNDVKLQAQAIEYLNKP